MELPIKEINEGGAQIRVHENEYTISHYAELMADGWGTFPPLAVVKIDGRFVVADGHHRLKSAIRAGLSTVPVEIIGHSMEEALEHAIRANNQNGLALTLADRQNMRRRAIMELPNKTATALAELCGCSVPTILSDMRKLEAEGVYSRPEKVVRSNGRVVRAKQPRTKSKFKNLNIDSVSPKTPVSSDTPKIEYATCTQCGFRAPLEMLDAPDSTWEKRDFNAETMQYESHFCCLECLTAWDAKQSAGAETPQNATETPFEEDGAKIPQEAINAPQTQNLRPSRVVSFEFEVPEAVSDDELDELLIQTFIEDGRGIKIFSRARNINNINNINIQENNINNINNYYAESKFVWILKDGSEYELPQDLYAELKATFPEEDVDDLLRKCIAWSRFNESKRKTRKGIRRHIYGWIAFNKQCVNAEKPAGIRNVKSPYKAAQVSFEDIPY